MNSERIGTLAPLTRPRTQVYAYQNLVARAARTYPGAGQGPRNTANSGGYLPYMPRHDRRL